jgi:hypothetical protein
MAISVISGSAQITVNHAGAVPDVKPRTDGEALVCNLTQGFNADDPKGKTVWAWGAIGQVDLSLSPGDEPLLITGAVRLGFIQIAKLHFSGVFWAGRKSSEGSVGLVRSLPPAWPKENVVSLDSSAGEEPCYQYIRPKVEVSSGATGLVAHVSEIMMGDHVVFGARPMLQNQAVPAVNYLFNLRHHFEYFSVMVMRDAKGITPLAHFRWEVLYDAHFRWVHEKPTVTSAGRITFDSPVPGGPTDPDVSRLLSAPTSPFTTKLGDDAGPRAIAGGTQTVTYFHNKRWFFNVPRDFWT